MKSKELREKAIEALRVLLEAVDTAEDIHFEELESDNSRFYVRSNYYGNQRWHTVSRAARGGVQFDQHLMDNEWSKRVNFEYDELPQLIGVLAGWWLEDLKEEGKEPPDSGDLDDNPF